MGRLMVAAIVLGVSCVGFGVCPVWAHDGVRAEIAALDAKIQKMPSNAALYVARASLYRREGHFGAALADLAKAEKLAPTLRDIQLERGLTLSAKGQTRQAEVALDAFLRSGPPTALALEARGKLREKEKRFVAARADYAAALRLRPDPELFLARGRIDEALSNWEQAARGYEEGLRVLSGAVTIRMALIRVETQRGNFERAISLVDEVLVTIPVKADWLLVRADLHEKAQRAAAARQDRERALADVDAQLARRPTSLMRVTRARALLALGQKNDAERELEAVLKRAPKLEEARNLLDRIRSTTAGK